LPQPLFCRDLLSGPVAPDPKDSYLLALAEASQAEFLLTSDKELLSLKQHKSTRIITPAAMIEILKKKLRAAERQILAGL
jgi:predicted nucleic acid-binding protein